MTEIRSGDAATGPDGTVPGARLTLVLEGPDPDRVARLAAAVAGIASSSGLVTTLYPAPGGLAVTVEGEAECVDDLLAGVVPALPGARVGTGAGGRTAVVVARVPAPPGRGRPG